jgi:hypothetical protein
MTEERCGAVSMDTHFLKAVLTAPGDHPRWETDLLAKLAGVPSQEAEQRTPQRPTPDKPLFITPRPARM